MICIGVHLLILWSSDKQICISRHFSVISLMQIKNEKCKSANNALPRLFKHAHTVPVYYNTVASHHMILHSRRYRCSATMMTSRHPLVPERVQLSSTQTLLAGWCVLSTLPAPQLMMPPWPSSKQRRFLHNPLTARKQKRNKHTDWI